MTVNGDRPGRTTIRLVAKDGRLFYPDTVLDLFDNREEGYFGDDDFIELPDHTPVLFDDAD